MMERVTEGNLKWKCTICGKCTKGSRAQMVRHVESHMEGVSHYCNRCCKVSRSGAALQVHMTLFHRFQLKCYRSANALWGSLLKKRHRVR